LNQAKKQQQRQPLKALRPTRYGTNQRAKFQDYDNLKSKLSTLEEEAEKKALAEKTEVEKAQHELTKAQSELEKLQEQNKTFTLKELKNKVLSDSKYSQLPSVYKNAVALSDNELDIQAEADKVLEQYQIDFGVTGKSFGKPTEPAAPEKKSGVIKTVNDLRETLNKRMNFTR
jgi:superfamily I DNA/RNA helicase